jgi:protein gp37
MGADTKIEWADRTWNFAAAHLIGTGARGTFCIKVHPGCDHCYAERDNIRFGNHLAYDAANRGKVIWRQANSILNPLIWTKPGRNFVNSTFDAFQPGMPTEILDLAHAVMSHTPEQTYILLTKYLRQMVRYYADEELPARLAAIEIKIRRRRRDEVLTGCKPLPLPNLQIGTSPCNQATWDKMIPYLFDVPAAKRIVSLGPQLGEVECMSLGGIDGVMVEGESGPYARICRPEWVRSARDQCVAAHVPFHFKQWGEWGPLTPARVLELREKIGPFVGRLPNGTQTEDPADADRGAMWKVGKADAGRELDGRTWDEVPS